MSLSIEIHETFLYSVFTASQECGKNPRALLREICENRVLYGFEGWVIPSHEGQIVLTDASHGIVDDALGLWCVKFANYFPSSVPGRNVRWSTVYKFASFYYDHSANTAQEQPWRDLGLDMSLDDIIVGRDEEVLEQVNTLSRHFFASHIWVDQFNEEERSSHVNGFSAATGRYIPPEYPSQSFPPEDDEQAKVRRLTELCVQLRQPLC